MTLRIEVTARLVTVDEDPNGMPVESDVIGFSHAEYLPLMPDAASIGEVWKDARDRLTDKLGEARNSVIAQAAPFVAQPSRPTMERATGGRRGHR